MFTRRLTPFEVFLEKQKMEKFKNKKVTKIQYDISKSSNQNNKIFEKGENKKSYQFLTNFFQERQTTFNNLENIPNNKNQNPKNSINQNSLYSDNNSNKKSSITKEAFATLNSQKAYRKLKLGQKIFILQTLNLQVSDRAVTPVLNKKFQNFTNITNNSPPAKKINLILPNYRTNPLVRDNITEKLSYYSHDQSQEELQEKQYYNLTKFYERKYNSKQHKVKSISCKFSGNKNLSKNKRGHYQDFQPWQSHNNSTQLINFNFC